MYESLFNPVNVVPSSVTEGKWTEIMRIKAIWERVVKKTVAERMTGGEGRQPVSDYHGCPVKRAPLPLKLVVSLWYKTTLHVLRGGRRT